MNTRFATRAARALVLMCAGSTFAACNDQHVAFVPKQPVAVITGPQDYAPLDTAIFDGSTSWVQDGVIDHYAWSIVDRPQGSTSTLASSGPSGSMANVMVDITGDYIVRLTVTDARGLTGSTDYPFHAVPWQTMHVELTWDTGGTDMDLHLVSETEGGNIFVKPFDCFFDNTNPDWGQPDVTMDDPSIDRDDVDGFGPEIVSLEQPLEGGRYHVLVHYYDDHGVGSSTATVRIYLHGLLRYEGIQAVASRGDGWDVATIDWPSGGITPIGTTFHYTVN